MDLSGDLKVRAVSRIVRVGAMATGITATVERTGDRARLEVAEFSDLLKQSGALAGKGRKRVGHRAVSCFKYYILEYYDAKKGKLPNPHF